MTTYYVSPSGSDSNNGLGPDASHATNKPWLTFGKVLNAGSSVVSGDTIYFGPGIYRAGSATTCAVSGSAGSPITLRGDPLNVQGFKDGSGVLLPQRLVRYTTFATDDISRAANCNLITLNASSFITFEDIQFNFGRIGGIYTSVGLSSGITINRCSFVGGEAGDCLRIQNGTAGSAFNWIILDTSFFCSCASAVDCRCPSHSSDYDLNITFTNCLFIAPMSWGIYFAPSDTVSSGRGGGLDVVNCTFITMTAINNGASTTSQTYPCLWKNNLILASKDGFKSGHASQVTADYNHIFAYTPRTNVTAGSNDKDYASGYNNLIELGFPNGYYFPQKPFGTPSFGSPQSGFGCDSTPTPPTTDLFGRMRPGGTGTVNDSVGCLERHDNGSKDTSTKHAGDASIKLTGPGDHELLIPVDASSTTISIKARYDSSTYGGTNYPQAILLDSEAFANISGNTETETATVAASDAWETLTFTSFTPSRKGVVRLRLVNRGTGGDDVCWFDTVAVS